MGPTEKKFVEDSWGVLGVQLDLSFLLGTVGKSPGPVIDRPLVPARSDLLIPRVAREDE